MSKEKEILEKLKKCNADMSILCRHFKAFRGRFNRVVQMKECMSSRNDTLVDIKDNLAKITEELIPPNNTPQ